MINKTELGFGTCQLGGVNKIGNNHIGMGPQKEKESLEALKTAYKKGIRLYDTADIYGSGKSEKLLGTIFRYVDDVIICSKVGNRVKNKKITFDFSFNYVNASVDKILNRIKKKRLDILLVHSPPVNFKISKDIQLLIKNLKKNKISNFGISFKTVNHAMEVLKDPKQSKYLDYIEIIYNVLDRRAEKNLFVLSKKRDIKIIARMPFANGFLAKRSFTFSKQDFRYYFDKEFIKWIKQYKKKIKKENINSLEFCIRFFYQNKYIRYVIPGMRSKKQVLNNVKNFNKGKLNKKNFKIVKNFPNFFYKWS